MRPVFADDSAQTGGCHPAEAGIIQHVRDGTARPHPAQQQYRLLIMPWPTILVALCLAAMYASLVVLSGWQLWTAFLVVTGVAGAASFALILLVLCLAEDPKAVWRLFASNVHSGIRHALKHFGR